MQTVTGTSGFEAAKPTQRATKFASSDAPRITRALPCHTGGLSAAWNCRTGSKGKTAPSSEEGKHRADQQSEPHNAQSEKHLQVDVVHHVHSAESEAEKRLLEIEPQRNFPIGNAAAGKTVVRK